MHLKHFSFSAILLISLCRTTHPVPNYAASLKKIKHTTSIPIKASMQAVHCSILGSEPVNEKYRTLMNSFLAIYGFQQVPLYKLSDNSSLLSSNFTTYHEPIYVAQDGIWLDESQLDQMKEAQRIFEFGYAATTFANLEIKDTVTTGLLKALPYGIATLINLCLINSGICTLSDDKTRYRALLKDIPRVTCCTLLTVMNYLGIKYTNKLFVRPTLINKQAAKTTNLLALTSRMLEKHGYSWVVQEYLQVLKKYLPNHDVIITFWGKPMNAKQARKTIKALLSSSLAADPTDA